MMSLVLSRKFLFSTFPFLCLALITCHSASADIDSDLAKLKKTFPEVTLTKKTLGSILSFCKSELDRDVTYRLKKNGVLSENKVMRLNPLSYLVYFGERFTVQALIQDTLSTIRNSKDSDKVKKINKYYLLESVAQTLYTRLKLEWAITFSITYLAKEDLEASQILMLQLMKTLIQNGENFLLDALYTVPKSGGADAHQKNRSLYIYKYQPALRDFIVNHQIIERVIEELMFTYFKAVDNFSNTKNEFERSNGSPLPRKEINRREAQLEKLNTSVIKAKASFENFVTYYSNIRELLFFRVAQNVPKRDTGDFLRVIVKAIAPLREQEISDLHEEIILNLKSDPLTSGSLRETTLKHARPAEKTLEYLTKWKVEKYDNILAYTKADKETVLERREREAFKPNYKLYKKPKKSKTLRVFFGSRTTVMRTKGGKSTKFPGPNTKQDRLHPVLLPVRHLNIFQPGSPLPQTPPSPINEGTSNDPMGGQSESSASGLLSSLGMEESLLDGMSDAVIESSSPAVSLQVLEQIDDDLNKVKKHFEGIVIERNNLELILNYINGDYDREFILIPSEESDTRIRVVFNPLTYLLHTASETTVKTVLMKTLTSLPKGSPSSPQHAKKLVITREIARTLCERRKFAWLMDVVIQLIELPEYQDTGMMLMRKFVLELVQRDLLLVLNDIYTPENFFQPYKMKLKRLLNAKEYKNSFDYSVDYALKDLIDAYITAENTKNPEKIKATKEHLKHFIAYYSDNAYDVLKNRVPILTLLNVKKKDTRKLFDKIVKDYFLPPHLGLVLRTHDFLLEEIKAVPEESKQKKRGHIHLSPRSPKIQTPSPRKSARFDTVPGVNDEDKLAELNASSDDELVEQSVPSPRQPEQSQSENAFRTSVDFGASGSQSDSDHSSAAQPHLAFVFSVEVAPVQPPAAAAVTPMEVTPVHQPVAAAVTPMEVTPAHQPVAAPAAAEIASPAAAPVPPAAAAPAVQSQLQQRPLPYYKIPNQPQTCSRLARLIFDPRTPDEMLYKWLQKARELDNFCQINDEYVPVVMLLLQSNRDTLFERYISEAGSICDLNQKCKEDRTIREATVYNLLVRNQFNLVAILMENKTFVGTPEQKTELLQMITDNIRALTPEGLAALKGFSESTLVKSLLKQVYDGAERASDFQMIDFLISNNLTDLNETSSKDGK